MKMILIYLRTQLNIIIWTSSVILVLFFSTYCSRVEELSIFGESRKQDVLGQDGVTPIPLTESITLWTFGDTILGSWKGNMTTNANFEESTNISGMISNTLAFTDALTSENIENLRFSFLKENGKVCQFIKLRQGENHITDRLWAMDGIRIGNRVYVYYLIIKLDKKGGPRPFFIKGVGIAVWDVDKLWKIGDRVFFNRLPNIFNSNYPAFGVTVLRINDYIYTVGHYTEEDYSSPIKIARSEIGEIEIRASYKFLSKDGRWVKDINKAEPFLGDVMGECSLSYNEYLKKYVIIYCQQWTGKIIMVLFNNFRQLYRAKKEVIYEPPKLIQRPSKLLWYYSGKEIFSIGSLIYMIYINPVEYQPYLLRINLKLNKISNFIGKGY